MRISKETLRAEIERLRDYQQSSEFVFGKLVSGDHVDFIVQELQNGKTLLDIQISLGGPLSEARTHRYSLPPSKISSANNNSENGSLYNPGGDKGGAQQGLLMLDGGISGDRDTESELGTYKDAEP